MHWPLKAFYPEAQQSPFMAGLPSLQVRQTPVVGLKAVHPGVTSTQTPLALMYWLLGQVSTSMQSPKTLLQPVLQTEQRPLLSTWSQLGGNWWQQPRTLTSSFSQTLFWRVHSPLQSKKQPFTHSQQFLVMRSQSWQFRRALAQGPYPSLALSWQPARGLVTSLHFPLMTVASLLLQVMQSPVMLSQVWQRGETLMQKNPQVEGTSAGGQRICWQIPSEEGHQPRMQMSHLWLTLSKLTHSLGMSMQVVPTKYWLSAQTMTVGVQVPLVSRVQPLMQLVQSPVSLLQVAQRADTFWQVLLTTYCLSPQTTGISLQTPNPSIVLALFLQVRQQPVKASQVSQRSLTGRQVPKAQWNLSGQVSLQVQDPLTRAQPVKHCRHFRLTVSQLMQGKPCWLAAAWLQGCMLAQVSGYEASKGQAQLSESNRMMTGF